MKDYDCDNFGNVLFRKSQALTLASQLNTLSHSLYMVSYDCFSIETIEAEMQKTIDKLNYLKNYYDIALNDVPDAFKDM